MSSLVFQITQFSVSRRVSVEICLSWSSMESHAYTVLGFRVTHQLSSFLEDEGRRLAPPLLVVHVSCLAAMFV